MTQITRNELVAFIYNETTSLLSEAITRTSEKDEAIREELNSLLQVKNQLGSLSYQPMKSTVDKIMMYARLSCCPN